MIGARRDATPGAVAAPADASPGEAGGSRRLPGRFVVSVAAAVGVVALAAVIVALEPPLDAEGYVPVLAPAGFICLALLVRRSARGLAWASLVAAGLIAARVPIAIARAADPGAMELGEWLVVAARAIGAAVATVSIAALYATRPERRAARGVTTVTTVAFAWFIGASVLVIALTLGGQEADEAFTWIDVATGPTALFAHLVVLLAAFGAIADVRAAAQRADLRDRAPARGLAARTPAILRELVPGASDDAAAEAERTRLAGDLHAAVLPALRRAIDEAEAGGPPELLAARLRTIDTELERLMADRWPVVLETFGLIAALEDLAERLEAESGIPVELAIDEDAGRPPAHVERAAWRVTQLALDNAVRHAEASRITVAVAIRPGGLRVSVADDGRGFERAAVAPAGGRGLPDIARRAESVGGRAAVESTPGRGTVVRFDWSGPPRPGI